MSDEINHILDMQELEITTRQILGKQILTGVKTLWQESKTRDESISIGGNKRPLKLYVINDLSSGEKLPQVGSPVKDIKLCKRIIEEDYPKSTLVGRNKIKISHCFSLIFLVEYENGNINMMTFPKQIALPSSFDPKKTMAIIEPPAKSSYSNNAQSSNQKDKFTILNEDSQNTFFHYAVALPIYEFNPPINPLELDNPTLQAQTLLKNLNYEVNIQDNVQVYLEEEKSIWTTCVELSLSEDIIVKLGIEQDIKIQGIAEYTC